MFSQHRPRTLLLGARHLADDGLVLEGSHCLWPKEHRDPLETDRQLANVRVEKRLFPAQPLRQQLRPRETGRYQCAPSAGYFEGCCAGEATVSVERRTSRHAEVRFIFEVVLPVAVHFKVTMGGKAAKQSSADACGCMQVN